MIFFLDLEIGKTYYEIDKFMVKKVKLVKFTERIYDNISPLIKKAYKNGEISKEKVIEYAKNMQKNRQSIYEVVIISYENDSAASIYSTDSLHFKNIFVKKENAEAVLYEKLIKLFKENDIKLKSFINFIKNNPQKLI